MTGKMLASIQTTRRRVLAALATGVLAMGLLTSCFPNTRYVDYRHTDVRGWEKDSVLTFYVSPLDEGGPYVEELGLRTEGSYPFLRLSLVIEQQLFPSGKLLTDTLNLPIYDQQGKPIGRGLSIYQQELPFRFLHINEGDSLAIRIHHNMLRRSLPGVTEVGIHLLKRE
ncbi:MAG: gliding motility lipoprotein GldH [Prevotella sp.]|nr:gliding motility lipoprotein GldH [Prevotella sp.]